MAKHSSYYFDTLPLHPQPKKLESFISYLTRLCEANCISSMWQLGSIAFPGQSMAIVRNFKDYPLPSFEHLQILGKCSQQQLWQTTFYHLGKKFDRATSESLVHFLQSSVANCFRYCPYCLAEEDYYSLTWRFINILGCSKHKSRLLGICCHCQSTIPLFTQQLSLGICSKCGKDLRQCQSSSLTDEELRKTLILTEEIEYLLIPQEFEETTSSIKKRLGLEFVFLRQKSGARRKIVSDSTKVNCGSLATIEFGTDSGTSFDAYLKYAQYLGVSFSSIFINMLQRRADNKYSSIYIDKKYFEEEEVLVAVQETIDNLALKEEAITLKKISQLTFISEANLKKHTRALALIEPARHSYEYKKHQVHEQELLKMAQQAVSCLNERGEPITYRTINSFIGISSNTLSRYPLLKTFVEENYTYYYQRQKQSQERDLIPRVKNAIKQIEKQGEKVTFLAVSKIVGTSMWVLRTDASIRTIILSSLTDQEENCILLKVREAINNLEDAGIELTIKNICGSIPIYQDKIRANEQAWKLLTQITRDSRLSKKNLQKQEETFIADVNNAIQALVAKGEKVTQGKVCKLIGTARLTIKKCSKANEIIQNYINEQKQQQEEILFTRVQVAIQNLIKNGQPITSRTIGEAAEVIPGSLFNHPRIAFFVKKAVNEQKLIIRLEHRTDEEDKIIQEIHEEVARLKQFGKRISITVLMKNLKMSYQTLRHYPKAKEIVDNFNNTRNKSNSLPI